MSEHTVRPAHPASRTVLVGLVCLAAAFYFDPLTVASASSLRRTPIVEAVQRARPSVVNIRGEKTLDATAAQPEQATTGRRVNGMGTGVVIDQRGYIVTNFHVVDGVKQIQVTLADGKRFIARLIRHDPETDLAIIKINPPEDLPVIEIGTSSDLMIGEPVIAVGNAYGYEHTVTRGIISAIHRAVQVSDAQHYADLIQTDASINPGNSGGPLLNIDGQMIGVNVAVRAGAQGIGFAIPIDKVMEVAAELLAANGVKTTWHGVVVKCTPGPSRDGLVVASVEKDSPAAEAGLMAGDVLARIGGLKMDRPLDFQRALLDRAPGDKIAMSLRRDEESLELDLTLAAVPRRVKPHGGVRWDVLGLELKSIPRDQFRGRYKTRYRGGLAVEAVRPDSPAAAQGIRGGDVLVGMHIWETVSLDHVDYILNRSDLKSHNPVKFFILRGSETLYGYLPLTMKGKTRSR